MKDRFICSFVIGILTILLSACTSQEAKDKTEESSLQEKVLQKHDKIMPEMEKIVHQRRVLTKKGRQIDSLHSVAHKSPDNLALKTKIRHALGSLDSVDHSMMNWMNALNLNFENKKHAEVIVYLNKQYDEVNKLDSALQDALKESSTLIEQIDQDKLPSH